MIPKGMDPVDWSKDEVETVVTILRYSSLCFGTVLTLWFLLVGAPISTGIRFVKAISTILKVTFLYRLYGVKKETHEMCSKIVADRLVELGGVWAKIGQFVALRGDLIPVPYLDQLARCQDKLPFEAYDKIKKRLELAFGCDIESIFEYIDPVPLASATIAQVHRGRLKPGFEVRDVVVKVQHAHVARQVQADLILIRAFHQLCLWLAPNVFAIRLVSVYLNACVREVDFVKEAESMETIRTCLLKREMQGLRANFAVPHDCQATHENLHLLQPGTNMLVKNSYGEYDLMVYQGVSGLTDDQGQPLYTLKFPGSALCKDCTLAEMKFRGDETYVQVRIPVIVSRLVSKKVIVMSYLEGHLAKYSDDNGANESYRKRCATMTCRAFIYQLMACGISHGDPHPANILFSKDGTPGIIDFGLCARIEPKVIEGWANVIVGLSQINPDMVQQGCLLLGFRPDPESDLKPLNQMFRVFSFIIPSGESKNIDKTQFVRLIFKHGMVKSDFLFVVRITNYLSVLCQNNDSTRQFMATSSVLSLDFVQKNAQKVR